jgi:pimeloyl-ACP methyl ester carboxylesterase
MTGHYFENDLVTLHYYKFGNGPKSMLCFHGYGMHGKQFKVLEPALGEKYTFYGFDLFFHKETKLKNQLLPAVKEGISKKQLADLITEFCGHEGVGRFSVIGYSMGTHYATVVTEELAPLIDELILAAPSSLNPGVLIKFFSKNRSGNKFLQKLVLHEKALTRLLRFFNRLAFINDESYKILYSEIGTAELRFNFYACFTYLRFLETDRPRLLKVIKEQNIKSIFIFGKKDRAFPPKIGTSFISALKRAHVILLNEGHQMIKKDFVNELTKLLL